MIPSGACATFSLCFRTRSSLSSDWVNPAGSVLLKMHSRIGEAIMPCPPLNRGRQAVQRHRTDAKTVPEGLLFDQPELDPQATGNTTESKAAVGRVGVGGLARMLPSNVHALSPEGARAKVGMFLGGLFSEKPGGSYKSRADTLSRRPFINWLIGPSEPLTLPRHAESLRYFSSGAMLGSPISWLYWVVSEGTQDISRMSKPRGCNRSGNLFSASQGCVYILGSSIITVTSMWS